MSQNSFNVTNYLQVLMCDCALPQSCSSIIFCHTQKILGAKLSQKTLRKINIPRPCKPKRMKKSIDLTAYDLEKTKKIKVFP